MQTQVPRAARTALWLLLTVNLFNYIDRYVLSSVEPEIRAHFFAAHDSNAHFWTGTLGTAFLVSYMLSAPVFGWLADRMSRWLLISISVVLWSCATMACGLAGSFALLFALRLLVGVGEGGYGPAAPTIISDYTRLPCAGGSYLIFMWRFRPASRSVMRSADLSRLVGDGKQPFLLSARRACYWRQFVICSAIREKRSATALLAVARLGGLIA